MAATSVLLADDDPRLRQFLELELGEEGYAVRSCGDGIGALLQIRQEPPDLLVLDWMLPDLSPGTAEQRLNGAGQHPSRRSGARRSAAESGQP